MFFWDQPTCPSVPVDDCSGCKDWSWVFIRFCTASLKEESQIIAAMNYSKHKEVKSVAEVEKHANMVLAPRFSVQLHVSFSAHKPFLVQPKSI